MRLNKIVLLRRIFFDKKQKLFLSEPCGEKVTESARKEGGCQMSNISELDLQNLRHLIGGYDTTHCKMQEYAKEATDPQVKQFFEKGARSAMDNKQQLMKFLQ